MASKTVEVKLSVGAIMNLQGPLRRGVKEAGKFQQDMQRHFEKLENIKSVTALIDNFEKLNKKRQDFSKRIDKQRQELKKFEDRVKSGAEVSQTLAEKYKRQSEKVQGLEAEQRTLNNAVAEAAKEMNNYGVSIGDVSSAKERLKGELQDTATALDKEGEAWKRHEERMTKIKGYREDMDKAFGKAQSRYVASYGMIQTGKQIGRSLWNPVNTAMSAEEAFAEVRKVVDFDGKDESAAFQKQIVNLSKTVPMAIADLYQIVAAAGQAGIPKDKLIDFAQLASRVGTAFDITSDEAGSSLAGIRTALGLNLDQVELYADAINHLSNKMAATAPDLLNFTSRVIGDFQDFGLAKEEATAVGAAMLAVKVPVDVAATSFRNMGKALAKGESATKRQKNGFKALGLSAEQVAKDLQLDAKGTIMDVFERLEKLPEYQRASVRSQIFGDEARGLGPLIKNLSVLKEAWGLIDDAGNYKGSAMGEYNNRINTSAAKFQIFQNQLEALKVNLGNTLLPLFNEMLEKLGKLVNWMSDMAEEYPGLAKSLGVAVAAVAALTAGAGAVTAVFATAGLAAALSKGGWGIMATTIEGIADNLGLIGDNAKSAKSAMNGFGGVKGGKAPMVKGLVGKAGLLNAVTLGFAAYETGQAFSEMKRLDEMSPEEKAASKKKLDDKLALQNKAAENLPGIGWLYKKTTSAHKAMFGDGEPKTDLAAKRDDLAELDRRIAALKRTAIGPQAGEMLTGPLQQQRVELVAEIDRLSQSMATAGLDEATRLQADGVRASGLPEAMKQTADQIRGMALAASSGGAAKMPKRALGGAVKAGQTYHVNEHGRGEMLVSDLSGRILSHTESMRSVRAAAQGASETSGSGAAGRHSAAPSVGALAGGTPQVHMHLSVSPQVSVDASGGAIDEASLVRLMEREMAQFANSPQMAGAMRAMLTRLWRETQLTSYQNGALV
ncbi:phage tail tape measure protein [uncultured Cohaesibacter sp.]|uniref:phage tail tape measure protein n=1 Tax=uncultured Cohaesibacter sp. TaxID=1002546 RepID=UPI002AAB6582|nr:phage tail tape measure protein [uncultured Cohaesibacter sp.]